MIFTRLYDKVLCWAKHPHAIYYLALVSFIEAIFFPIPVAVMLAPMVIARPKQAWWLVLLATMASVLGGMVGYSLGYFSFELITPVLQNFNYWDTYLSARAWMEEWGVGAIFLAGVSPIPYKIATITAGVLHMSVFYFFIASVVGRSAQFALIAGLFSLAGESSEQMIRRYVEWIGWGILVIAIVLFLIFR